MDLWDVAKLMGRRWYVGLPVLVLTVVAALVTASTVEPDYTATANVTLLPPVNQNTGTPGQVVNPWDTQSLTIVTLAYLNSKRLHDQMEDDGFSPVWEADTDPRFSSLIIIKVTASTREGAQATAGALQRRVAEQVASRQAAYPITEDQKSTTVPLGEADLELATGKLKRALIVVVGVGIIVAIALTVSFDAFLRRRAARRRTPTEGTGPAPASPTAEGPADSGQPATGSRDESAAEISDANGSARTTLLGQSGVQYELAVAADPRNSSGAALIAIPVNLAPDDEATVVLPLSNGSWAGSKLKRVDPTGKAAGNGKR